MRAHQRPSFDYDFDLDAEIQHLHDHLDQDDRRIPDRADDNLLVATWNLTNFGVQRRLEQHLRLMAETLAPFDLVAVQEVADDLTDFFVLADLLGEDWDYYYTDVAGNQERLAYLFRCDRVVPRGLAAELAMRGYERRRIVVEEVEEEFEGFNRNPYMLTFEAGDFEFTLVNVHLYWSNFGLRQLETNALGRWAASRATHDFPPNNDIILIGDFNMPRVSPDDEIYRQLSQYGLRVPDHRTNYLGTNLAGDAFYDEILFFPGRTGEDYADKLGVVDFDTALFPDLFQANGTHFFQYIRYYIADHRPLWAEFRR